MKKLEGIVLSLLMVIGFGVFGFNFIFAETIQDIQPIDAETRNRLEKVIASNSGSGQVFTNSSNTYGTGSTNTFNGLTIMNGILQTTSSNILMKPVTIGTNAVSGSYALNVDTRANHVPSYSRFAVSGAGGLEIGIPSSAILSIDHNGGAIFDFNFSSFNEVKFSGNSAGTTIDTYANGGALRIRSRQTGVGIGPNGASVSNIVSGTITFDAPSLAAGGTFQTNLAVTGSFAGASPIIVGCNTNTLGIIHKGWCTNNGTIWFDIQNVTNGAIDQAEATYRVIQWVIP